MRICTSVFQWLLHFISLSDENWNLLLGNLLVFVFWPINTKIDSSDFFVRPRPIEVVRDGVHGWELGLLIPAVDPVRNHPFFLLLLKKMADVRCLEVSAHVIIGRGSPSEYRCYGTCQQIRPPCSIPLLKYHTRSSIRGSVRRKRSLSEKSPMLMVLLPTSRRPSGRATGKTFP